MNSLGAGLVWSGLQVSLLIVAGSTSISYSAGEGRRPVRSWPWPCLIIADWTIRPWH